MATNYIQPGEVIDYIAPAAITSGAVVVIGARVGVALAGIGVGEDGPVQVCGVFVVPKATGDAPAQGALLYWDASAGVATTTDTDNTLMGYAFGAAAGDDASVKVKLNA